MKWILNSFFCCEFVDIPADAHFQKSGKQALQRLSTTQHRNTLEKAVQLKRGASLITDAAYQSRSSTTSCMPMTAASISNLA
jgi:hypothetical protein